MRTIERIIEYKSRSDVITIKPFFDIHLGSALCDEARLKEDIKEITDDPQARWILGGDACEFITRKDRRHVRENQLAPWLRGKNDLVTRQLERFEELFQPIREKCLAAVLGNHEDYMQFADDQGAYRTIIRTLSDVAEVEDSDLALGA